MNRLLIISVLFVDYIAFVYVFLSISQSIRHRAYKNTILGNFFLSLGEDRSLNENPVTYSTADNK